QPRRPLPSQLRRTRLSDHNRVGPAVAQRSRSSGGVWASLGRGVCAGRSEDGAATEPSAVVAEQDAGTGAAGVVRTAAGALPQPPGDGRSSATAGGSADPVVI